MDFIWPGLLLFCRCGIYTQAIRMRLAVFQNDCFGAGKKTGEKNGKKLVKWQQKD